jgi:hypothetical protein
MNKWLSSEWFDEVRQIWARSDSIDGVSGRVQCEITGGPDGDVSCHWVLASGRLSSADLGRLDDPEVVLTLSSDDAMAVQRGVLDPNVAFMQGRLKVTGSMGLMISLLSLANTSGCQQLREEIAEVTEF